MKILLINLKNVFLVFVDLKTEIFTKLKKSAKINNFGGWVTKGKIGSEFRPTHSQNFRSLAPKLHKL